MAGYIASFLSGAVIGIVAFSAYAWWRTYARQDRDAEHDALVDEGALEGSLMAEVADINFGAKL